MLFSDANLDSLELYTTREDYSLCDLILRTVERYSGNGQDVKIGRTGLVLIIKHNRQRILRLCSDLGTFDTLQTL